MAEVMVINPRRRRGRRRKSTHRKAARATRRRRRAVSVNPVRRRRRSGRRRAHARRVHRNPRGLGSFMGVNVTTAGGTALGIIGANLATAAVLNNVPGIPASFKTGPTKIVAKAAIGIGVGLLVKKVLKQNNLGNGIMAGGIIAAALDAFAQYVQPSLPAQLQDYELTPGVGVYELGDGEDDNVTTVTGMGDDNSNYESMYD